MRSKAWVGVATSNRLPPSAPAKVTPASGRQPTPPTGPSSSRNAQALVAAPGSSATLLVALAALAGSPSAISAGSVAKVPPPASAFIAPPTRLAAKGRAKAVTGIDAPSTGRSTLSSVARAVLLSRVQKVLAIFG